jgi:hypothetical protein
MRTAEVRPVVDPRQGDIENDASSTKRRSMLSLAGSLLVEISLPKLVLAWTLLLVIPGLLLGLAPIIVSSWLIRVSDKITSLVIGIWSALLFIGIIALGWFGWRALSRMAEKHFWSLNSIVVEPGYAAFREGLAKDPGRKRKAGLHGGGLAHSWASIAPRGSCRRGPAEPAVRRC